MRTSLSEIKLIDDHLFNRGNMGDKLLFDAMLIIDDGIAGKVLLQKKTHTIIQQYSRKKLKAEIEAVHQKLFNEPSHKTFREKIMSLFRT
jgi:hypothetical protein